MKANEIYPLVEYIHQSPYKNIMIDGCWGVGKSYEIQRALKENSNSCILSLFGINNCKEIFSSLIFKLECKNEFVEKVCKATASIGKVALERFGAKDAFPGAAKEATFMLLKPLKDENYILIFDDLERVGRDFNFEEFFGIIEELKQLDGIKVILIANTDKFNEANKEIYDKYHEKVIDKIYKIEEPSSHIDWENIGVEDHFFTEEYTENFNITNLRTIQKAEQFIKDGITSYKKMGEKINFFKSDDELKKLIEDTKLEFFNSSNFIEALKQADTILTWMKVLEIDSTDFFSRLKEKLEILIDDAIDKDSKINEFYALWTLNSKELKEYVEEMFKSLDKITFEKYISSIKVFVSNGDYRKAYMKIKDISDREWQGIEESKIIELLNSDILPLGSISEEQWRVFKALKDLFMKTDYRKQLWFNYIKIAEEENKYDKAFLNRMNSY